MNRRDFLKSVLAGTAAALGLGAASVAEAKETEADTLLGMPIEETNFDEPETVLIGPMPIDDAQVALENISVSCIDPSSVTAWQITDDGRHRLQYKTPDGTYHGCYI